MAIEWNKEVMDFWKKSILHFNTTIIPEIIILYKNVNIWWDIENTKKGHILQVTLSFKTEYLSHKDIKYLVDESQKSNYHFMVTPDGTLEIEKIYRMGV